MRPRQFLWILSCLASLVIQALPVFAAAADGLSEEDLEKVLSHGAVRSLSNSPSAAESQRTARLQAILSKLGPGSALIAPQAKPEAKDPNDAFRSELLANKIGFVRLGEIDSSSVQKMESALNDFHQVGATALILDLRECSGGNFAQCADLAALLLPTDGHAFTLRDLDSGTETAVRPPSKASHALHTTILISRGTKGPAEVLAALLQAHASAFALGQRTAGEAAEFDEIRLSNGSILRLPKSICILAKKPDLFPKGLAPDLALSIPEDATRAVLSHAAKIGKSAPLILETSRPKLNEAALLANQNPETEEWIRSQLQKKSAPKTTPPTPIDRALQRAVDFAHIRTAINLTAPTNEQPGR